VSGGSMEIKTQTSAMFCTNLDQSGKISAEISGGKAGFHKIWK